LKRLSLLLLAGALATATSRAAPAVASANPSSPPGALTQKATPPTGTQVAELGPNDGCSRCEFGSSVAVSGDMAVVGDPSADSDAGTSYVFTKEPFGWSQVADLAASDGTADAFFAGSVTVSGKAIVVGASFHAHGGRAYVFTNGLTGWRQAAELHNGISNTDAAYIEPDGLFGDSVAISGNTIVVGVTHTNGGAAYVFTGTGTGWHESAELPASVNLPDDGFGASVAISAGIIAVG
jgi:hypothetical protein